MTGRGCGVCLGVFVGFSVKGFLQGAGILSTAVCTGLSVTHLDRVLHSLRMISKEGWEGRWQQELPHGDRFDKQSGRVGGDNDVVGLHRDVPVGTRVLWLTFGQKHPLPFLNGTSQKRCKQ